jgi:hypothetical protein
MARLVPEVLLAGHGPAVIGAATVVEVLHDTSAWLRPIVEQPLERLNRGECPEDVARAVKPPPHLARNPYLQPANRAAQEAKRDLFRARSAAEPSLMARDIFDSAVRAAESALRKMD